MQKIADTVKCIYSNPIDWARAKEIAQRNYTKLQRRYDKAIARLVQVL